MKKLIGLSLSRCLPELVEGKVKMKNCSKIMAGTSYTSLPEWTEAFRNIARRNSLDIGDTIDTGFQLLCEGRIEQPRLTRNKTHNCAVYWVDSEDKIIWDDL